MAGCWDEPIVAAEPSVISLTERQLCAELGEERCELPVQTHAESEADQPEAGVADEG
jgi:hypothetical protein